MDWNLAERRLYLDSAVSGIAAIAGHNWPLYFHFRGGKGIATAIGVLVSLAFLPALCAGVIAILSIVLTRYVSLGSLIFVAFTPIFIMVLPGYSMQYLLGESDYLSVCVLETSYQYCEARQRTGK